MKSAKKKTDRQTNFYIYIYICEFDTEEICRSDPNCFALSCLRMNACSFISEKESIDRMIHQY
jgi:hypothetical protein